ncbi:tetratricopeptide repeat protein [Aliisedimentitalea scapharcae]|uniref:Tetratricopeptide repeat protein n=1 Tax=Aliisedimentitalea scapharcae TaxID=1524259 RepID=A0ABZ2XMS7_9RHOB
MDIRLTNLKGIVAATVIVLTISGGTQVFAESEADLLAELAQSDPKEAIGLERELKALWGNSGSPAMNLLLKRGRDALERGDTREAIEHFTALTDHAPDFAEGWNARASAFYDSGLIGPALADLERALYLNPNNYDAIFGLGVIFEQFGDSSRAYAAYSRAQAIHPHHDEVTKALERLKPEVEGEEL